MTTKETESWRGLAEMVRRARSHQGRASSGYYAIEGTRLHERALRAGVSIKWSLVSRDIFEMLAPGQQKLIAELQDAGCQVIPAPPQIMAELTAGRNTGKMVGLVKMPRAVAFSDLIGGDNDEPALILVAVEITDPGNAGALMRTAHAYNAQALIIVGVNNVLHPRAVRMSRGSVFKMPVLAFDEAKALLPVLEAHSFATIATVTAGGQALTGVQFEARRTAVFMGNEGQGLTEELAQQLNQRVTIPMTEGIDSFSVNAAAAVVLFEVRRQWSAGSSRAQINK